MGKIWSDERKFPDLAGDRNVLACEANGGALARFQRGALPKFENERDSIPKILEIEKRTNHDVIAFLKSC